VNSRGRKAPKIRREKRTTTVAINSCSVVSGGAETNRSVFRLGVLTCLKHISNASREGWLA